MAEFRSLEPGEQLARVRDLARQTGALSASSSAAELTALFETFRRNLGALVAFRPGLYEGPVDWFRAGATRAQEPQEGWAGLAAGGLTVHPVPGDHHSILRPPHVDELAQRLRAAIEHSDPRNPQTGESPS
jgi:thioesterase domain-containing protein